MTGIGSVGWALPRMLHDGRRVPAFDEDVTTLAVQALRRADPGPTLAIVGEADDEVVPAAAGHDGEVVRARDVPDAVDRVGDDGLVVEAYAPRMGPAWAVAARLDPDGDPLPEDLSDLLPDDAPGVEVGSDTVNRHVDAFDVTREETTPMGAYVSPQVYRESLDARYRLVGRRCPDGHVSFPPKPRCPTCGADALAPEPLSGRGTVHSVTVIGKGAAPAEFTTQNQTLGSYAVAIVALEEGPRIAAQITDCDPDAVAIDDPVRATFRRIYVQRDGVRYGTKFQPVERDA